MGKPATGVLLKYLHDRYKKEKKAALSAVDYAKGGYETLTERDF